MIVTIDGPAGSGKSTAAHGLAQRLGFTFLDTGAMYRAVAYSCLSQSVDPRDEAAAASVAENLQLDWFGGRVCVAGQDVTDAIRSVEVTEAASLVAAHPLVRTRLVQMQREMADGQDVVAEGRDQGTVAFPHAECKFFLIADATERARRRHRELVLEGKLVSMEAIQEQIQARDHRDETRAVSPLLAAEDAIRIDTSHLRPEELLDLLEEHVRRRRQDQPA